MPTHSGRAGRKKRSKKKFDRHRATLEKYPRGSDKKKSMRRCLTQYFIRVWGGVGFFFWGVLVGWVGGGGGWLWWGLVVGVGWGGGVGGGGGGVCGGRGTL